MILTFYFYCLHFPYEQSNVQFGEQVLVYNHNHHDQNNGNDFLNDERPKSDEPNDTKIDENLDEPIFDEKKNSIKSLTVFIIFNIQS